MTNKLRKGILARLESHWEPGFMRALSIGDGWLSIIDELTINLESTDPGYRLAQIKEKFGSLRVYAWDISAAGQELVTATENKASKLCMVCGRMGTHRKAKGGWYGVVCDTDAMDED